MAQHSHCKDKEQKIKMFSLFQFTSPFVDRFKYVVYGCTNYADRADNGFKKNISYKR